MLRARRKNAPPVHCLCRMTNQPLHAFSCSINAIAAAGARTLPSWMKYTKRAVSLFNAVQHFLRVVPISSIVLAPSCYLAYRPYSSD